MSASADIQTKTHSGVLAVPINAVTTRDKSDTGKVAVKKDEKPDQSNNNNNNSGSDSKGSPDDLQEVVFIMQADGTVKKVKVKTGIQDINYIEILDGVKANDDVITGPYTLVSKTLRDGTKVKVVPKEQLFEQKK